MSFHLPAEPVGNFDKLIPHQVIRLHKYARYAQLHYFGMTGKVLPSAPESAKLTHPLPLHQGRESHLAVKVYFHSREPIPYRKFTRIL